MSIRTIMWTALPNGLRRRPGISCSFRFSYHLGW